MKPNEFKRRLSVTRPTVEPGIINWQPPRAPHAIADPQRRLCGSVGGKIDADFHLARLGQAVGPEAIMWLTPLSPVYNLSHSAQISYFKKAVLSE